MSDREPSAARIQARARLRRGARHVTPTCADDVRECTECGTWLCDDHDTTDESED